jgi:hypothetical protein
VNYFYHVTYAMNLPGIARRGLVPGGGQGVSIRNTSLAAYSKQGVFLTLDTGVAFWVNHLASGIGPRTIRNALPWVPVVLRIPAHERTRRDPLGERDTGLPAFWTRAVPKSLLEAYGGDLGWLPVARYAEIQVRSGLRRCGEVFDNEQTEFSRARRLLPAWCVRDANTSPLVPVLRA